MTDSTTTPDPTNNPTTATGENPAPQPAELQTPANTPAQQPFAHDRNHEQNEVAGASRGEFGRQSDQGTTQGGYGNELSRGDATYAGPLGQPAATSGYDGEREQRPAGKPSAENGSFGTQAVGAGQPAGSAVGTHFANDNAAPKGTDSGFADNYGTTSLGGAATSAQPEAGQRNQREDYTPNHPEGGPQGLHTGAAPSNASQGTDEAEATPGTGSRSGYRAAGSGDAQGGTEKGFGSKGGSYNDEYDDAKPAAAAGSPAQGDFDKEEGARNYGGASDDRTNAAHSPDYGSSPGRPGSPD
jgi:hypothetical protein